MIAQCERTDHAAFLHSPALPEYRDGNRALRVRSHGANPDRVANEIRNFFLDRDLPATVDLDPIAEAEGIGAALAAIGIRPIDHNRLLMRYDGGLDQRHTPSDCDIELVPNGTGAGRTEEWISTAISDDAGWPDEPMWRTLAEHEARYTRCRLYLARCNSTAVSVCDVFEHDGMARLESVVTRPEMRRRGIGAALVAHAIRDTLSRGCQTVYLSTEPGGAAERLYRRLGFVPWCMNLLRQYRG